jgi:cellulose synthase/poly-beta-1,6-N-acetylglucosamine synthase-like glycosyltransferase
MTSTAEPSRASLLPAHSLVRTSPPFVSVIVPVYRDADRLRGCVRALAGQTYPRERFEIIVVNNDPDWTRRSTRA